MDRGAWQTTAQRVAESDVTEHAHTHTHTHTYTVHLNNMNMDELHKHNAG